MLLKSNWNLGGLILKCEFDDEDEVDWGITDSEEDSGEVGVPNRANGVIFSFEITLELRGCIHKSCFIIGYRKCQFEKHFNN